MHVVSLQMHNATVGAMDEFYDGNLLAAILTEFCDGLLDSRHCTLHGELPLEFSMLNKVRLSVIGLARPNRTSGSYHSVDSRPNVLYELTASGVLDRNVMTLHLPKSNHELGSLTLGEDPPPATYRIPMSQKPDLDEGWIVDLSGICFSGAPVPLNISYTASAAVTLERDFAIALSPKIVDTIFGYLGASTSEEIEGGVVDCETLDSLPDLTLTLGGQTITFGWRQYAGS